MTHINNINGTSPMQNNSHEPPVLKRISQILIDAEKSRKFSKNTVLTGLLKNLNNPSSTDPTENLKNLNQIKSSLFPNKKLPQLLGDKRKEIITVLEQNNIDLSTIEKEIIKEQQQSVINTYTQMLTQMNSREKELGEEIIHLEQIVKQSDLREEELLNEIEKLKSILEQNQKSSSDEMTKSAESLRQTLNKNEGV